MGFYNLEGILYLNIHLNCNYIVSFPGFDIGGYLLDWRL
jgi:hypothetical protein